MNNSFINLANQAVSSLQDSLEDLAERYGAELTWQLDLASSLRWQINFHKGKARELQERIDELTEQVESIHHHVVLLERVLVSRALVEGDGAAAVWLILAVLLAHSDILADPDPSRRVPVAWTPRCPSSSAAPSSNIPRPGCSPWSTT